MINLNETVFELKEQVHNLPTTKAFLKNKFITVADFGTVFIGEIEDKEMSLPQAGAPTFSAPKEWRMPQLLKALGAFDSTSQARKNGWDKDIEAGCTSIIVRINKVRGEIWIHKEGL